MAHDKHLSRLLSRALRHDPGVLDLELDAQGYVGVDELLNGLACYGQRVSREDLDRLVADNDKQRFAFSEDGTKIRASQGHSVKIDLGYVPATPPNVLYHGTATQFLDSIRAKGLVKGSRQHVHLSTDEATAVSVGRRKGKPVVLELDAARMHADGLLFFISDNGVWLTDHVPFQYLRVKA